MKILLKHEENLVWHIAFFILAGRSPSVLKYEEGKSYIYNFETEVITSVVGTTDETNKIKVKGQASVAAQSACDLTLTVQQIDITSSSGQVIIEEYQVIHIIK